MKIVEFEKTKNHYLVLNENAKMKDPTTRGWVNCVIYTDYKKSTPQGYIEVPENSRGVYVREKSDFLKKFTLCLDL